MELKVSQAELRDLLLQQQQQQQQRSAAAKLHLQQLRLEAELKDCRARLETATEAADSTGAEQQQQNQREVLMQQLATYEHQLQAAEQQHRERLQQQEEQQKLLQEVEQQLQQLQEQSDRLLREKAGASAAAAAAQHQQQQQHAQTMHLLKQADGLGVQLPLQVGWVPQRDSCSKDILYVFISKSKAPVAACDLQAAMGRMGAHLRYSVLQRGTWEDVQRFVCNREPPQQQPQHSHARPGVDTFAVDWHFLSADRRAVKLSFPTWACALFFKRTSS